MTYGVHTAVQRMEKALLEAPRDSLLQHTEAMELLGGDRALLTASDLGYPPVGPLA